MGQRKQFTPEFTREAVQFLESGSRPASAIARELGVARNQLYKWQTDLRAREQAAFPSSGARKERTTELARLKRELARVTEERIFPPEPREFVGTVGAAPLAGKCSLAIGRQFQLPLIQMVAPEPQLAGHCDRGPSR